MTPFGALRDSSDWTRHRRRRSFLSSARLLVLSFSALIALGTLGFLFLPGLYTGDGLNLVDALFTATSAVCVTGLIVVDTAAYFTPLGQAWIALLVQLGGLGILTFTTLVALAAGRRIGLNTEDAAGVGTVPVVALRGPSLVRRIVALTFLVEGVGALVLWVGWQGSMGARGAAWPAVFHAVSAFCNAGFSIFSDSLTGYQRSPVILSTVMVLVVLGGLGFLVLEEVRARVWGRHPRLSLHARLVLVVTALLLVVGWVLFTGFAWDGELQGLSWPHRLVNGLFMSVTPRTAGFNTVDYSQVDNPSLFLTFLFMLIGGSPGSTAGGVKTVTVALVFLLLVARLRGEERVSVFNRTIPRDIMQRAVGLIAGAALILMMAIFLLLITEIPSGGAVNRLEFVEVLFEAGSAFGTVGLSMGVTATLTSLGRLIIIGLMFVGRVGPLAIVAAMASSGTGPGRKYRYGEEKVLIG